MPHHRLYTAPPKGHGPPPADAAAEITEAFGLSDEQVAWLRARLRGALLLPDDPAYPGQRFVFNMRYRPRPLAIVNVLDAGDVRTCLAFARDQGVAFRVRGGGHNFAGYSAGPGLVIDLTLLDSLTLDPSAGEVTVGGGCPQGELATLLAGTGWHLPLGDWPSVGVGGFMQGGGYGLTSRSLGLNLDHVIDIEVMLADGRVVTASATRNADLWWAVRGGTGNMFGVVLQVRYRLLRVPEHAERELVWPLASAGDRARAAGVLLAIQAGFMRGEANPHTGITCMAVHGLSGADPAMVGPWLVVGIDHLGTEAEMNAALAPLLALPGRVPDFDYAALNRGIAIPPLQRVSRYVSRDLTQAEFRAMLDFYATAPNRLDTLYVQALGGPMNAIARGSSAFIHRDAAFLAYLDVFWRSEAEREAGLAWQRAWCAAMAPVWNGHCYQNFADPTLSDYRAAYWGEAFPALLATKRKYDPDSLFRFPQMLRARPGDPDEPPVWPPAVVEALAEPIRAADD
jgi:FAD/FMN-containing dehydrogenase